MMTLCKILFPLKHCPLKNVLDITRIYIYAQLVLHNCFHMLCRHLSSQLLEMERLIDKMLSTEFERYATADLNRPLVEDQQILEGVGNLQPFKIWWMMVLCLNSNWRKLIILQECVCVRYYIYMTTRQVFFPLPPTSSPGKGGVAM